MKKRNLKKKIESLESEAAMYRWLKEDPERLWNLLVRVETKYLTQENWDADIAEAMKAEQDDIPPYLNLRRQAE